MYNQRRREKRQLLRTVKRKQTCNTCLTHACMNNSRLFCPQSNNRRNLPFCKEVQSLQYSGTKQSLWLAKDTVRCARIHPAAVSRHVLFKTVCTCSLRSLGVASITLCVCTVAFLYSYSKTLDEGWKLLDHCTSTSETEQNDMKSSSKCLCGFELHGCVKKERTRRRRKSDFRYRPVPCVNYLFVHMDRLSKCKITCRTRWWR